MATTTWLLKISCLRTRLRAAAAYRESASGPRLVKRPAALCERAHEVVAELDVDHELHEADLAARVVVDVDVLDVDLGPPGVGEQPGQLPGMVRHGHEHRAGRPKRATVLAGDG